MILWPVGYFSQDQRRRRRRIRMEDLALFLRGRRGEASLICSKAFHTQSNPHRTQWGSREGRLLAGLSSCWCPDQESQDDWRSSLKHFRVPGTSRTSYVGGRELTSTRDLLNHFLCSASHKWLLSRGKGAGKGTWLPGWKALSKPTPPSEILKGPQFIKSRPPFSPSGER